MRQKKKQAESATAYTSLCATYFDADMKAEWCKSDYCTLLGGGSGSGGVSYGGDYMESPESVAQAARILKDAGIEQ